MLDEPNWPDTWPYRPEDFGRYDETSDTLFYDAPRFVTHIDDNAIAALTKHYEETFPPSGDKNVAILDMCSSWIRCATAATTSRMCAPGHGAVRSGPI